MTPAASRVECSAGFLAQAEKGAGRAPVATETVKEVHYMEIPGRSEPVPVSPLKRGKFQERWGSKLAEKL